VVKPRRGNGRQEQIERRRTGRQKIVRRGAFKRQEAKGEPDTPGTSITGGDRRASGGFVETGGRTKKSLFINYRLRRGVRKKKPEGERSIGERSFFP